MRFLIFLLSACLCCAEESVRVRPSDWAQPMLDSKLGNFYKISEELFRSQQPHKADMKMLERVGIKSILSLRDHSDDVDEARGTKLHLYRADMAAGKIDKQELKNALSIIHRAEKPVLVHCWHGSDRTGLVVAMYRITHQNWPREKAVDELVNGGFGYHKELFPNIVEFLKNVNVEEYK